MHHKFEIGWVGKSKPENLFKIMFIAPHTWFSSLRKSVRFGPVLRCRFKPMQFVRKSKHDTVFAQQPQNLMSSLLFDMLMRIIETYRGSDIQVHNLYLMNHDVNVILQWTGLSCYVIPNAIFLQHDAVGFSLFVAVLGTLASYPPSVKTTTNRRLCSHGVYQWSPCVESIFLV